MSFDNRTRKVGQLTYAASTPDSLDLPRKNLFRSLILDWVGSNAQTDVTTPPVLYTGGIGSAFKHIARVEVVANGRDTIKSISGDAIAIKNLFLYGSKPQNVETLLTAATHPFGGKILLPFAMPRSIREIDTLLPSGKLSTLELRITFGAKAAMMSTEATAYAITGVVDVHVNESIRMDGKDEPYATYKELYIEKDVVAASAEFQVLLPVGNRYRGFLIEVESDGEMVGSDANFAAATDILKKVTIKSGTDVYKAIDFDVLQGENRIKYDLEDQSFVGYGYVDFCEEGRMVDALDATRLSSLEMILDVAHPGTADKIRIYPCEIVPPMPV